MSTPLEVIQEGEREFARRTDPVEMNVHKDSFWFEEGEHTNIEWEEMCEYNKSQTLSLLQAQHDELEEREMEVEVALGNPEAMAALSGYNDSIQDQQDNLQALMDKIRV